MKFVQIAAAVLIYAVSAAPFPGNQSNSIIIDRNTSGKTQITAATISGNSANGVQVNAIQQEHNKAQNQKFDATIFGNFGGDQKNLIKQAFQDAFDQNITSSIKSNAAKNLQVNDIDNHNNHATHNQINVAGIMENVAVDQKNTNDIFLNWANSDQLNQAGIGKNVGKKSQNNHVGVDKNHANNKGINTGFIFENISGTTGQSNECDVIGNDPNQQQNKCQITKKKSQGDQSNVLNIKDNWSFDEQLNTGIISENGANGKQSNKGQVGGNKGGKKQKNDIFITANWATSDQTNDGQISSNTALIQWSQRRHKKLI